jgi:conserved repeat protein
MPHIVNEFAYGLQEGAFYMGKKVLVILLLLAGILTACQGGKQKEETATSGQRNSNSPKVILQEKDFEIHCAVRKQGTEEWKDNLDVQVGDTIEFDISYTNHANKTLEGVTAKLSLPDSLEFVPGSGKIKRRVYISSDAENPQAEVEETLRDSLVGSGVNIGDYSIEDDGYVYASAVVLDKNLSEGNNILNPSIEISAEDIMVKSNVTLNAKKEDIETWGPQDRQTFTWSNPADHVCFNSMTDNPEIGDEANFVRVRKAGGHDKFVDNVIVEPGEEYEVNIYYHNNASASLNEGDRRGIAENVRLRMNYIASTLNAGEAAVIRGTISSSNAIPKEVWDTAYLNAKEAVGLRYVPNSAVLHNTGSLGGTVLNDDAVFGKDGGTFIGYSKNYWGLIPGCNEFAGYVTFRLKAYKL